MLRLKKTVGDVACGRKMWGEINGGGWEGFVLVNGAGYER